MPRRVSRCAQDAGQGLVEYAVILALTSLCIVLALLMLRNSIASPIHGTANVIQAAGLTHGQPAVGAPSGSGSAAGAAGEPGRAVPVEPR